MPHHLAACVHAPLLRAADPTLSSYQVEPRLKEVRNDHICTAQRLEDWVFWADQPLFSCGDGTRGNRRSIRGGARQVSQPQLQF